LIIYPLKLQNEILHFKQYRSFAKQKETELAAGELKAINQSWLNSIDRSPINALIANYYFNTRKLDSALVYYALVNETNPYLLNPCSTYIEDFSIDMRVTKRLKYYNNIIKQQEAKCNKLLQYEP